MSYIGNPIQSVAFVTDEFSGTGSTTAFTMSVAPANTAAVLIAISGIVQDPTGYSVSGTTLTFSTAPPSGTNNISCRYLGVPASGVTTTAYRTTTEYTATSGQTVFSPPSYTPGFVDVYKNGIKLGSSTFTATSGTSIVLSSGASSGDLVTIVSMYVSSVLNALPATGGGLSGSLTVSVPTGQNPLTLNVNGTQVGLLDYSGNLTIGGVLKSSGNIVAASGTAATNVTTGALTVAGGAGVTGNVFAANISANIIPAQNGNTYITGNLIPSANLAYSLGTTNARFTSLYLSGNTIDLGGATIKTDAVTGAFAFVPLPTTANPNPVATVVSPTGTITTVSTTGGVLSGSALSTAANSTSTTANSLATSYLIGTNTGNITLTGSIIPDTNIAYDLGTASAQFRHVFIGPGSLYINGKQVLTDNSGTITVGTSSGQNLQLFTSGGGDIQLSSAGGGVIQVQGPLQIQAGNNITSSDGNAINIADPIAVNSITSQTNNTNLGLSGSGTGKIQFNSSITGGGTVTFADSTASTSTGTGAVVVSGGVGVAGTIYSANIITTNGLYWANGTAFSSGTTYANANVAAYLPTYSGNISAGNIISTHYGNTIGTTATYSGNVTAGNIVVSGNLTVANIIYSNQEIITTTDQLTAINVTGGNLYVAGANLTAAFYTLQSNVGAFETYANATFNTGSIYANANVAAYLPTYSGNISAGNITSTLYGNTIGTTATYSGNISAGNVISTHYGNTIGTTATYSGNISAGNITSTLYGNTIGTTATYSGNISAGNLITTSGIYWANGIAFSSGSGSTYANANVAAYLPTYSGNISVGNLITTSGIYWANGNAYSSGGSGSSTGYRNVTDITATANQTVFSVSYTPGFIDVYRNGIKLGQSDYTATNGTTVTLGLAAAAGDLVEIVGFSVGNTVPTSYRTVTSAIATSGQTTFAVSYTPGYVDIYHNGVKLPAVDYTATSGTSIVLAQGCNVGDILEFIAFYVATIVTLSPNVSANLTNINASGNVGIGTLSPIASLDLSARTDMMLLPVGNTTQRPATAANGSIRFNITIGAPEWYSSTISAWQPFYQSAGYIATYLIVAGGGGGGSAAPSNTRGGGGGGAGGFLTGTVTVASGTSYTVTIGSGGTGGTSLGSSGTAGSNSLFTPVSTAIGGGYGGGGTGGSGGSGGGGGFGGAGGAGTSGQGNSGGGSSTSSTTAGGGGGGSSSAGQDNSGGGIAYSTGTTGGSGTSSSITGSSATYAAGGQGGIPGGGSTGASGSANTGNGGGGGGNPYGGSGGSGVVIISYINSTQRGAGGTVTSYTSGPYTYWVHTFTTSGTYTA